MDLIGYDEVYFLEITKEYKLFAKNIGIEKISFIPISAINGDNVVSVSCKMDWYNEGSLLELLENVDCENQGFRSQPFIMPVQLVNRPNADFRGVSGKSVSGYISVNDEISVFPSGKKTKVKEIITPSGFADMSSPGESMTLTFKDEIYCSRGQIISSANAPLEMSNQFEATIIWMHEDALIPGRSYYLKIGCLELQATCARPKYKVNVETH